jgi:hypothetical protein
MKVIRHDHKFMKQVFTLNPILKQSLDEEFGRSLRLKKSFLLGCGRDHKVSAIAGCTAVCNCHNTFRAKAHFREPAVNAALKRCSTHEKSFQAKGIVERINGSGVNFREKLQRQFQNEIEGMRLEPKY